MQCKPYGIRKTHVKPPPDNIAILSNNHTRGYVNEE